MNAFRLRIAAGLIVVGALAVAAYAASQRVPDAAAVTAWFGPVRHAWYAMPLVILAFVILSSMFVPVMLLVTATGLAFGPLLGPIYAMAGSLASGSAGFGLGRLAGPSRVEKYVGRHVPRLSRALERHGTLAVFVVRKIPLPFMLVNVVIGAMRVRYRDFMFGTMLGMSTGIVALAGFGGTLLDVIHNPTPRSLAFAAAVAGVPFLAAAAVNALLGRRVPNSR